MSARQSKISPELIRAITDLVKNTIKDKNATLDDKLKVIDRGLKLEALRAKIDEEGHGRGLFDEGE